jgi:hypothetical protein
MDLALQEKARLILEMMGDRMDSRLRKTYEDVEAGRPCKHPFCVGDDQTECLECSTCGKDLGAFNPIIDRTGDMVLIND